ncbi:two-component system response regulator [Candidatus Kaiserbacteria bacterium]|nr:MAG: two-component system response regulator [Candidatus Kaiserbacteria bacterium]
MAIDKNIKILIVDDSKFMRSVLKDILENNGYLNIIETDNGEDAISSYDNEKPDVVFLDLILPKIDGLQVLEDIIPKGAKVIVVSVIDLEDIINETRAKGAHEYIVKASGAVEKPFSEENVLDAMEKVFGE